MHAKWLMRNFKVLFTYSSFLLTFVLITKRLMMDHELDHELDPPPGKRATTRTLIKKTIKEDVPFKIVFEEKPVPPRDLGKVPNASSIIPGLLRVLGFSYDVFLFSAVVGNSSSDKSWDTIVIQGWEHEMYENRTFGCCIKYKSGDLLPVNMTRKIHWAYRDKTVMPVKQYICPNPRYKTKDLPEYVTIAGWTKLTSCHSRFNWYLKPYFAHRRQNDIAVCTKVIYGDVSADDILTWFEIHRRLGVSKVLSYTYDLNPDATKVLEHYKAQGILETFPFNLPKASRGRKVTQVGVKNFQAWNDEQIPVYDCLEKLKGYKYLVVMDIDEYLIPNEVTTLTELFDKLWKARPWAAGFTFLVHLHITSWNVTNDSAFSVGRYINRTSAMVDRPKHVTRPDRLGVGGLSTHMFTPLWEKKYKRFQAKESDATLHHFRRCRKDWTKKGANKSCMTLTMYRDTTVSDRLAPIESDILKLKSRILDGG